MVAALGRNQYLKSASRIQDVTDQIASYYAWYSQEQPAVADSFFNVQFAATKFLTLTGQVGRVDITEAGHIGVLLGAYDDAWNQELRMPLLQAALSERYGFFGGNTSIGVQRLDGGGLQGRVYTEEEVNSAIREFSALAQRVEVAYRRYRPNGG